MTTQRLNPCTRCGGRVLLHRDYDGFGACLSCLLCGEIAQYGRVVERDGRHIWIPTEQYQPHVTDSALAGSRVAGNGMSAPVADRTHRMPWH